MAHLITGFAGVEHIQSADDGAFNASFFGEGQFVMEQGSQFEASIINNNTVRVLDGNGLMYGRHFRIKPNEYEDIEIETGTAGTNRIDLIVMTYEKDSNDGTESVYLQVIKGTESSGSPVVPSYTDGNILEGATKNQMPLYKVKIEGVVLSDIESLFTTIPTYKALSDEAFEAYQAKLEALQGSDILDTLEEIEANTQSGKFAGALAVKDFYGIRSHIGMIVQSTTLDTEAKVKAIYGGSTWTRLDNMFLVGAGTSYAVNSTGGSATNTLTTANLPSHTHGLNNHTHGIPALSGTAQSAGEHSHTITHMMMWDSNWTTTNGWTAASSQTYRYDAKASCSTDGAHTHSVTTNASTTGGNSGNTTATGSGTAVNNLPPYKAVYIWERTA